LCYVLLRRTLVAVWEASVDLLRRYIHGCVSRPATA